MSENVSARTLNKKCDSEILQDRERLTTAYLANIEPEFTPRQKLEQELIRARRQLANWQKNSAPDVQGYLLKSQQRVSDLADQLAAMSGAQ